jgi:hypothetical protein
VGLACSDHAQPFVLEPWRPTECPAPFVLERRGDHTPGVGGVTAYLSHIGRMRLQECLKGEQLVRDALDVVDAINA